MNELYQASFEAESVYHICARSNNQEALFKSEDNRRYFLLKFDRQLSAFLDVYAYCLMDNHVHFLIKIKTYAQVADTGLVQAGHSVNNEISEAFRRFFIGYSMAFNKQQGRSGNLFQRPFRRVLIDNELYFTTAIAYIHCNPYKHLKCDYRTWIWSSYQRMLTEKPTKIPRDEVLAWFGSVNAFVSFHEGYKTEHLDTAFWLEE